MGEGDQVREYQTGVMRLRASDQRFSQVELLSSPNATVGSSLTNLEQANTNLGFTFAGGAATQS